MIGIAGILPVDPGKLDECAAALSRLGAGRLLRSAGRLAVTAETVEELGGVTVALEGRLHRVDEPGASAVADRRSEDVARIAKAWRSHGPDLIRGLDGRFSLALLDHASGDLFLGCDRFCTRPIHFARSRDRVLFASDASTVMSLTGLARAPDVDAIAHCLAFGFPPPTRSLFRGIRPLPAAHRLVIDRAGRGEPVRYWDLPSRGEADGSSSVEDFADRLAGALRDAVAADGMGGRSAEILLDHLDGSVLAGSPGVVPAPSAVAASSVIDRIEATGELLASLDVIRTRSMLDRRTDRDGPIVLGTGADIALLTSPRYGQLAKAAASGASAGASGRPRFVRDIYAEQVALAGDDDLLTIAGPFLAQALVFSPADEIGPSLEQAITDSLPEAAARVDLAHGYRRVAAAFALGRYEPDLEISAPFLSPSVMELCASEPRDVRIAAARILGLGASRPRSGSDALPMAEWLRTSLRTRLMDTFASGSFRRRDLVSLPELDERLGRLMSGVDRDGALIWSILCLEIWMSSAIDHSHAVRTVEPMGLAA